MVDSKEFYCVLLSVSCGDIVAGLISASAALASVVFEGCCAFYICREIIVLSAVNLSSFCRSSC